MQKLFNKILVPIDFSLMSKWLLEKAKEMALQYNCTIHLLQVMPADVVVYFALERGGIMLPLDAIDNKAALESGMNKLCNNIPEKLKDKRGAWYIILTGNWEEVIIGLVQQNTFDLLLINSESLHLSVKRIALNPNKIAQITGVSVRSVSAEKQIGKLGAILITVTNFLSLLKLIYSIYQTQASNIILRLVGLENKVNTKVEYYLAKCFSLLLENCSLPIELQMIESNNVAKKVKSFAGSHATDLIILNPGTQTKIQGFFARLTGIGLQNI